MTCIVAVECKDGAVIAGDYCGSNGFTRGNVTQSKVFRHSGMMFGYTTSFRFGQIIEYMLDDNTLYPPTDEDKTYEWLVRVFIPKLKSTLKGEDYNSSGNALCVVNGQVWEIQNDFSVLRSTTGVASVGSGEHHMTSSIITQLKCSDNWEQPTMEEAINMIRTSYDIVGEIVPSVSKEHSILKLKK